MKPLFTKPTVVGNACPAQQAATPSTDTVETTDWLAPQSQRRIHLARNAGSETVTIKAPNGAVELRIRLTADGPVVELDSASLQLTATRDVTVHCERFVVDASEEVAISSSGNMCQHVGGALAVEVEGKSRLEAHSVEARALRGNIELSANDDVALDGERIFLNR